MENYCTMFNGRIHHKCSFSIVMLIHQRVGGICGCSFLQWYSSRNLWDMNPTDPSPDWSLAVRIAKLLTGQCRNMPLPSPLLLPLPPLETHEHQCVGWKSSPLMARLFHGVMEIGLKQNCFFHEETAGTTVNTSWWYKITVKCGIDYRHGF